MARSSGTFFKTSAYFAGAVTGLLVALPLVAASVGAVAASRSVPPVAAIELIGPSNSAYQAPMVNRAAKGARLEATNTVAPPAAVSTHQRTLQAQPAMPKPTKSPTRAVQTPRGCLSALGVTKSNLATEELTVCVADASVLRSIN